MKAGTAVRLFRTAVLVVVLLVSAIPALTAISEMGSEPVSMKTESTYELRYMDEDTLADNLNQAVSGRNGCTVVFGTSSTPVDESNCDAVAKMIVSSDAERATVFDSDGMKLTQESITYRNDVVWGGRIGVTIPGMASDVSDMDIRIRFFSTDRNVDMLTDSVPSDIDGEIGGQYLIPIVAYNVAGAYGCEVGPSIGLEYEKLVRIDAFSKSDSIDYDYELSYDRSVLTVRGCMASGAGTGTIGNASVAYTYDEGWNMTISGSGRLSEVLASNLEDGCLIVTTGNDSYTMNPELTSSFISTVKALEERA